MFSNRQPFRDRRDAGRKLAAALQYLKESDPIVLALPRGGVPVAFEVAQALHARLDVFLVRKIGAPDFAELGLGAIAEGRENYCVINQDLAQRVRASEQYLEEEKQRQLTEMTRRRERYRGGRELVDLQGRTVVVIDDGMATGGTMKVALQAIAAAKPERLLFAVPVAPNETLAELCDLADDAVCLLSPDDFRAVSQYYGDFDQTSDEEVIELLQAAASFPCLKDIKEDDTLEEISPPSEAGRPIADEARLHRPSSDQAGGRF